MARTTDWGRTLAIVNPTAHAGAAAAIAERLRRFLALYLRDTNSFEIARTERPKHATELARNAEGFDTVLALGGDGVVHEVVNGLMQLSPARRPTLGVVPVGSGNDFARTLRLREVATDADLVQLLDCKRERFDVGCIRTTLDAATDPRADSSGTATEHYIQTLSFGLDAAIGLGTMDLRRKVSLTGSALYTLSGLKVFGRGYRAFPTQVRFDGEPEQTLDALFFALQLGPTYGSGFQITPDADPTDGLLDICYAYGPVSRATALAFFLSAKNGKHLESRHAHLLQAREVELAFDEDDYPIQADGERIRARRAVVDVLPGALNVLVHH